MTAIYACQMSGCAAQEEEQACFLTEGLRIVVQSWTFRDKP